MARKAVKAGSCIIEGEMIGIDKEGRPLPFQYLSQRIKRKYNIERVRKEIPVVVNLFDITFLDGRVLFGKALRERRGLLQSLVTPIKGRFKLSEYMETRDIKKAEKFYQDALSKRHEGLIVKNLEASYQPGRRVAGGWLKIKPTMENLDLVIIGATWGTGKRVGWLGSLVLGCRNSGGEFLECGMIGTGIKEKSEEGVTFDMLTRLLRPHVESEKGSSVRIKPRVVVEVAYEEIQKSTNYSSGFALRFPRVVRVREDRRPEDVDTVERLERLFSGQRGRK